MGPTCTKAAAHGVLVGLEPIYAQLGRASTMETPDEKTSYIRDVWQENLESDMANIREMVVNFPCISMVRCALSARKSRPPSRGTHGMLLPRNLLNIGRTLSSRASWQNQWAASNRTATTIIRRCVATSTC